MLFNNVIYFSMIPTSRNHFIHKLYQNISNRIDQSSNHIFLTKIKKVIHETFKQNLKYIFQNLENGLCFNQTIQRPKLASRQKMKCQLKQISAVRTESSFNLSNLELRYRRLFTISFSIKRIEIFAKSFRDF